MVKENLEIIHTLREVTKISSLDQQIKFDTTDNCNKHTIEYIKKTFLSKNQNSEILSNI